MSEPMTGPTTRCPWCSAELTIPGATDCLACGATLVGPTDGPDPEIRGLTALDPEAILRARREVARPRRGLLAFLTGDLAGTPTDAPSETFAPPSDDVRREMLRLRLEAERADLVAHTVALKSDVLAERGIHLSELGGQPVDPQPDDVADSGGGPDAGEPPA
jgi:hypothetical protein